jgi:glycosyltransferase involved in cell wall biosynthesis
MIKPFIPNTKMVWGIRCSAWDVNQYDWVASMSFMLSCKLSRFADAIIVNSYSGRDYHEARGYPAEKMMVIPNGIDTARFYFDPVARAQLRSNWGIGEHQKLIGLVGRLDPVKDHQTFLRAAALLAEGCPHFRFICVGDGPAEYKSRLVDLAGALKLTGYVTWVDSRDDIFRLYSAMDLLVSSSCGEGSSNVIGEAMACGVPCVVTNVGDSAQLVADQGTIVKPKDPEGLMAAMDKMLNDTEHNPVQIRNKIVTNYSVEHLVIRTEALLSRITSASR